MHISTAVCMFYHKRNHDIIREILYEFRHDDTSSLFLDFFFDILEKHQA